MSLGCFVERQRFLQLRPRKTSYWQAEFFDADLSSDNRRFRCPFFDMSNIQQYNNSRKEGGIGEGKPGGNKVNQGEVQEGRICLAVTHRIK